MKKKFLTWSLLLALGCLNTPSSLRADAEASNEGVNIEEPVNPLENSLESTEYVDPDEYEENVDPKGTPVSPSKETEKKAQRKEFYKNIVLASLAVIVAVVSIIVVSNNNGSKN